MPLIIPLKLSCIWMSNTKAHSYAGTLRLAQKAHFLVADGTLVASLQGGQLAFLKLYHGNRRLTLAEACDQLRPPDTPTPR